MLPLSCVCPRCDTTLRVKDRAYLNRPIPCPVCRAVLVLAVNESEQLIATLEESAASGNQQSSAMHSRSASATLSQRLRAWASNVTVVSWTATLLVAGMIGLLLWRSNPPRTKGPADIATVENSVSPDEGETGRTIESNPAPGIQLEVPKQLADPEDKAQPQPAVPVASDADASPVDALTVVKAAPPHAPQIPAAAAPPAPPVDFERALSQPLAVFRQSRAIARLELLELLEELLGAPIRYDADELGDAAKQLDEKIAFELQDITVGDVLARVLDQTGIAYEEERDGLRLRKESGEPAEGTQNH